MPVIIGLCNCSFHLRTNRHFEAMMFQILWYLLRVLLDSEQIVNVHSTVMDDDSCVLKYIEIVPLENNAEQFEDLKPFQVKVSIIANVFV